MKFWKGVDNSKFLAGYKAADSKLKLKHLPPPTWHTFLEALKFHYNVSILPIEKALNLNLIYPVPMDVNEFETPSTILFLGLPSVGKTALIRSLLRRTDAGVNMKPEYANRFTIIRHGAHECTIPAFAQMNDRNFPYPGLRSFGEIFARNCDVCFIPSPLLEKINIIDTPGMTTMGYRKLCCGYDFEGVIKFFAEKAGKIVFVYDIQRAQFLEDNVRMVKLLKPYEYKIMVILNKIDTVDWNELDKLRSSLMWSLSVTLRMVDANEILLLSSLPEKCKRPEMISMIYRHQDKLLAKLSDFPFSIHVRFLHEIVYRARLARTYALICNALPHHVPTVKGKAGAIFLRFIMKKLIKKVYPELIISHSIKFHDLPNLSLIESLLTGSDGIPGRHVTTSMIHQVEDFLRMDVITFVRFLLNDSQREYEVNGRAAVLQSKVGP
ncbi:hypothetical protein D918_05324 [Trichuris suis]|nr:hypothetical protein D918_05324 [Trichuris suis]